MVAATVTVVKAYDAAFVRRSGGWARFLLRQPVVRVRQAVNTTFGAALRLPKPD